MLPRELVLPGSPKLWNSCYKFSPLIIYTGWFSFSSLYSGEKLPQDWAQIFVNSYGVHMYSSSVYARRKILRPKYYGKLWPAYLHLAINHCPLSYYSEKMF